MGGCCKRPAAQAAGGAPSRVPQRPPAAPPVSPGDVRVVVTPAASGAGAGVGGAPRPPRRLPELPRYFAEEPAHELAFAADDADALQSVRRRAAAAAPAASRSPTLVRRPAVLALLPPRAPPEASPAGRGGALPLPPQPGGDEGVWGATAALRRWVASFRDKYPRRPPRRPPARTHEGALTAGRAARRALAVFRRATRALPDTCDAPLVLRGVLAELLRAAEGYAPAADAPREAREALPPIEDGAHFGALLADVCTLFPDEEPRSIVVVIDGWSELRVGGGWGDDGEEDGGDGASEGVPLALPADLPPRVRLVVSLKEDAQRGAGAEGAAELELGPLQPAQRAEVARRAAQLLAAASPQAAPAIKGLAERAAGHAGAGRPAFLCALLDACAAAAAPGAPGEAMLDTFRLLQAHRAPPRGAGSVEGLLDRAGGAGVQPDGLLPAEAVEAAGAAGWGQLRATTLLRSQLAALAGGRLALAARPAREVALRAVRHNAGSAARCTAASPPCAPPPPSPSRPPPPPTSAPASATSSPCAPAPGPLAPSKFDLLVPRRLPQAARAALDDPSDGPARLETALALCEAVYHGRGLAGRLDARGHGPPPAFERAADDFLRASAQRLPRVAEALEGRVRALGETRASAAAGALFFAQARPAPPLGPAPRPRPPRGRNAPRARSCACGPGRGGAGGGGGARGVAAPASGLLLALLAGEEEAALNLSAAGPPRRPAPPRAGPSGAAGGAGQRGCTGGRRRSWGAPAPGHPEAVALLARRALALAAAAPGRAGGPALAAAGAAAAEALAAAEAGGPAGRRGRWRWRPRRGSCSPRGGPARRGRRRGRPSGGRRAARRRGRRRWRRWGGALGRGRAGGGGGRADGRRRVRGGVARALLPRAASLRASAALAEAAAAAVAAAGPDAAARMGRAARLLAESEAARESWERGGAARAAARAAAAALHLAAGPGRAGDAERTAREAAAALGPGLDGDGVLRGRVAALLAAAAAAAGAGAGPPPDGAALARLGAFL
eukprot:tig00000367_g24459.t1